METKRTPALARSLQAIELASRGELNALFEAEFGRKPAPRTSLDLMRQNLTWAAQSRTLGKTPRKWREQLVKQLNQACKGGKRHSHLYRPGTRLVREWQGKVHEVTVLENGYTCEGQTFTSLSQVAMAITGTKWSGPRFFGLKGKQHVHN